MLTIDACRRSEMILYVADRIHLDVVKNAISRCHADACVTIVNLPQEAVALLKSVKDAVLITSLSLIDEEVFRTLRMDALKSGRDVRTLVVLDRAGTYTLRLLKSAGFTACIDPTVHCTSHLEAALMGAVAGSRVPNELTANQRNRTNTIRSTLTKAEEIILAVIGCGFDDTTAKILIYSKCETRYPSKVPA
jgi:DNA-binding NarL/FixJ family response regulator